MKKYVRRACDVTLSLALLLALASAALAQYQVPNYNVPIGRGGGNQGFKSAAPGVAGNVLKSNGPTSDPSFQPVTGVTQTFDTKALAAAATIDPSVTRIETLGYATVNDNGGAFYIRTATTGATSYRFQSADGQWWTLFGTTVTPEQFACFSGGADCTAALQVMTAWLNSVAPNGTRVSFKPGALYLVWSNAIVTPSPSFLFQLTTNKGLTFDFNGATLTTDNLFSSGVRVGFFLSNNTDVTINDPRLLQTAFQTPLDQNKGVNFIAIDGSSLPYSGNVIVNNLTMNGGQQGFSCSNGDVFGTGATETSPGRLQLNNARFTNVYYPLNFQNCGDNFTARGVKAFNTGREYFPYGVSNHDVEMEGDGGGPFDNVLLKVYADPRATVARRQLSDIRVRYRNIGRVSASASTSILAFEFQQTVPSPIVSNAANNGSGLVRLTVNSTANMLTGQTWYVSNVGGNPGSINAKSWVVTVINATTVDLQGSTFGGAYTAGGLMTVPATMKNIRVELDVDDTNGNGQPAGVLTRKFLSDGSVDTQTDGYTIDNVTVTGTLNNYNGGIRAIDVWGNNGSNSTSQGTWTGETIRNFNLHDLTVSGTNSSVLIDNSFTTANLSVRNFACTSGITTTLTGSGATYRPHNVSCGTLQDRQAVASFAPIASQFLTGIANGVPSSAQPAISGISGLGTGVAAALAVNIGSAGAPVLFNGAGGTPSSITLTNGTGLPVSTGISGLGTGVAAALAVNVGTAGSFVVNGGALGSPSSVGTLPAHTLGGTISGGGNQINNVRIGASTPLAGDFTVVSTRGAANQGVDVLNGSSQVQVFFRWNASIGGYFGLMNAAATQTTLLQGEGTGDNYFAPTGAGAAFGFNTTTPTAAQTGNVGMVTSNGGFKHSVVTVANLPTCNAANAGARYGVSNANATTFLSTVAGGGANLVPVYCNGTNWVIG